MKKELRARKESRGEILEFTRCRGSECTKEDTDYRGVAGESRRVANARSFFKKQQLSSCRTPSKNGANVSMSMAANAVSKAEHERVENCFLTLFPRRSFQYGRVKRRNVVFFPIPFLSITFSFERHT